MKFALASDLHLHSWNEFNQGDERLMDCVSVFDDILKHCLTQTIKHFIFGGDLLHKRGTIPTRAYALIAAKLRAFKDAGITCYALTGNHDMEDADGEIHALQPLMYGRLITGVNRRGYRVVRIGDTNVVLFSYCDSRKTLAKRIRSVDVGRNAVGIFHHGFKGARVGSVLEYEVKEPIDARKLKLHKLFRMVFSGHYHSHQQIVGVPNGWYIGSPLEHTRSDKEAEKGFLVVDTKTMTFERVKLKRPRFVSVNVGDDLTNVKGNFVDVVYAKADESLDVYLAAVKKAGARGVNPVALPSAKKQTKKRLNVSPTLAPKRVLKRYVKHRKADNSAELLVVGMELVRTVEE